MTDLKAINDYLLTLEGIDSKPLLDKAKEAMQGMLILPGTGAKPVFVGNPPRWEDNPYGVGGYTWTISRLQYMVTLCKAFLATKERRYLEKVEADLMNWFETVPAPPIPHNYEEACFYHGVHNWRMLELGYRMVHTFPTLLCVLRTYSTNKVLLQQVIDTIEGHAERLAGGAHLLWPERNHNHYTEEIIGLLACASMLPEHPKAGAWADQAMEGLEIACAAQISEEGSQIEGAGLYHTAVVINFCYSIHFANRCGRTFSPQFLSRVRNSLDFSIHITAPDGGMLPFGDAAPVSDAGITAALISYLVLGEKRQLVTLRQFLDTQRIQQVLQSSCPWGFDHIPEVLEWLKIPLSAKDTDILPLSTYQREMDQYIVRTEWSQKAVCLYFSSHSPIHYGNHAHMDQLGIIFGAYGKILLQDPGRYTYKDGEDRHLFKSSQVHSLPTVDGRDGFEYIATFAYGPQKEGAITAVTDTERIKGAYGYHENYSPAVLFRSVALIDGMFLLIADTFHKIKDENMKIFFHINSTNVEMEGTSVITKDQDVNIRITPAQSDKELSTEIIEGRLSDISYHDYPSARAVFTRRAVEETETLFFAAVPFTNEKQDELKDFCEQNGILTFSFGGSAYKIVYKDGIFSME